MKTTLVDIPQTALLDAAFPAPKLISHEITTLMLRGEPHADGEPWEGDDMLEVDIVMDIDGYEHDVRAIMTISASDDVHTSYSCESACIAPDSDLSIWLGERIDEIWAAATESPEEADFRRLFGRKPDAADRTLGLTRAIEIARALGSEEVRQ